MESKKYLPFSNSGRNQCEILNTCRLIYSEILMVQSKDFFDSLGFCKSDKGSIGKILAAHDDKLPALVSRLLSRLLSDQAMYLYYMKKSAKNGRFSVLANTFQGQKHGYKDFKIPWVHNPHYSPTLYNPLPLHPVWFGSPSQIPFHQPRLNKATRFNRAGTNAFNPFCNAFVWAIFQYSIGA